MQQFAQKGFPEIYEEAVVRPLFRPWAERLIAAAGVGHGDRVLDIACGTGIVARLARERAGSNARVAGLDVNPGMLAVGRRIAPDIEWIEGDAGALPFPAHERFDVVLCQQGMQFFPDRSAAAREMYRMLESGGRLAVSTWRPDEESPFLLELRRVAERRAGPIADRRHSFGDASLLNQLLIDAGFNDVETRAESLVVRFADATTFAFLNAMALIGMSAAAADLNDEARSQLVAATAADSRDVIQSQADGPGVAYEIGANVATARRS